MNKFDAYISWLKTVDWKALQRYDWRSLQKYTKPRAAEDLNRFLEKLPTNAGKTILIAAAVAWGASAMIGLYTTVQIQKITELRKNLQEAEALKPLVPQISDIAIKSDEVQEFAQQAKKIYPGLDISARDNIVSISAKTTAMFGQFREAIGFVQNGGSGWRVSVASLCVGRECKNNPLSASLKINKVSVDKPT